MGEVGQAISLFRATLQRKEALNMHRTAVGSPGIEQLGYEEGSEILEIKFSSGTVYEFYNVPSKMYEQLMNSPRKELFYETNILVRFPYKRLE